jgi:alkanesulfonate monooxygenase SsuD/methylene tetrahydromethanopterin reductase-like flavin-dependent oxidoreductase (luciferase family)
MNQDATYGVALPNYAGNSIAKGNVKVTFPIDYAFPMNDEFSWEQMVRISKAAEMSGYDSIWASDHHMLGLGNFEAWTSLAALSSIAKRVKMGTFVSCNSFRNPALVAKMAANLGTISNGRFILGYGAGWYKPEYDAYGYEFPEPGTRVRMLREGLIIIRGMLREKCFSFSGQYYRVKDAINEPRPAKEVPIMVGGGGDRIIGLAAEYADIWDIGPDIKPKQYEEKTAVLRRELRRAGRSPDAVTKSMHFRILIGENEPDLARKRAEVLRIVEGFDSKLSFRPAPGFNFVIDDTLIGTPHTIRERLKHYRDLGCQQFVLHFTDYPKYNSLELFSSTMF